MKISALKVMLPLALAASLGAFSFAPNAASEAPADPPAPLHEVYLGQTKDGCSTGHLSVKNRTGIYQKISDGVQTRVELANLDASGYWSWKCGTTLERSRMTTCPTAKTTLVYVTHKDGEIYWKCYSHR